IFVDLTLLCYLVVFFFQAEDGIRDFHVTGVQTCALPIYPRFARSDVTTDLPVGSRTSTSLTSQQTSMVTVGTRPALGSELSRVRSEERRVGKECRCRWWPAHEMKKEIVTPE